MVTKTKTTASGTPASSMDLEARYTEALALVGRKDTAQAKAMLEALLEDATSQGHVSLARAARVYLANLASREEKKAEVVPAPELAAQVHLNRGETDEALALLDKALAERPREARLFYLKATAHALKDQAPESAEALRQATALNPDYIHQYRLEKDFDRVRHLAPFVTLGVD
jgi:predicted Zn-dependent protease